MAYAVYYEYDVLSYDSQGEPRRSCKPNESQARATSRRFAGSAKLQEYARACETPGGRPTLQDSRRAPDPARLQEGARPCETLGGRPTPRDCRVSLATSRSPSRLYGLSEVSTPGGCSSDGRGA